MESSFSSDFLTFPKGRIDEIDQLKGLAILLIVFYHATIVLGIPNLAHGEIGVDIFVLLSGIGLTQGNLNLSLRKFMRRRLGKILPTYWLALGCLVLASQQILNKSFYLLDVFVHFFDLHGFTVNYFYSINDSWWFMTLIVILYLVFYFLTPFIMRGDAGMVMKICLIGSMAATFYFKVILQAPYDAGVLHFGSRFIDFGIGIWLGILSRNKSITVKWDFLLIALFILQAYLAVNIAPSHIIYPALALVISLGYLFLASHMKGTGGQWIKASLKWIGLNSYAIYLIHQPLIRDYNLFAFSQVFHAPVISKKMIFSGILAFFVLTLFLSWGITKIRDRYKLFITALVFIMILVNAWLGEPLTAHLNDLSRYQGKSGLILGIVNPNGTETVDHQTFFWIGSRKSIVLYFSIRNDPTMEISGNFLPGSNLPENQSARVILGANGSVDQVILPYHGVIRLPSHWGVNIIELACPEKPTYPLRQTGDTRTLMVGVKDLQIDHNH
jgi:peptidoglycan/LPS O-acetylase OafA/YrhL